MTDQPTATEQTEPAQTDQPPAQTESLDTRWVTLQRAVAVGMIVVVAIPQVVIQQELIPPLAIIDVVFAAVLALTWLRPRRGSIGIGVLSGLWMVMNLANSSQVIPDLVNPSATLFFMVTLAMLVLGVAGLVGLVGVLRHASGRLATRTLQTAGAVLLGGLGLSLLAGLV